MLFSSAVGRAPARAWLLCKSNDIQTDVGRPFFDRGPRTVMAMKDGKKRRPPKSAAKEFSLPEEKPEQPKQQPRVDPSMGNIRWQLKWVQVKKEYQKKATQPFRAEPTRAFRQPSKTEEEYKEERRQAELKEAAEVAQLSKQESKNFALRQIHNSMNDSTAPTTVLLVDGYNYIGARATKNESGDGGGVLQPGQLLSEERDKLIEELGVYSTTVGVRVVVAFDAMGNGTLATTEETMSNGVTVVYCGDQEADSYIAKARDIWLKKAFKRIVVASNDNLVRLGRELQVFVHDKVGKQVVYAVSIGSLRKDVSSCQKKLRSDIEENNLKQDAARVLAASIAPSAPSPKATPNIAQYGAAGAQNGGGAGGKKLATLQDLGALRSRLPSSRPGLNGRAGGK